MGISLLSTTRAPEQLRALAIAMVPKAMTESQNPTNVVLEKDRNIAGLQNRIRILEEQMTLARQQRFG
ncbi:TPA: IS66 family transposase, partial [Escherichia coli]|nr:IS66 family transposase [Escherichia coli]